MSGPVWQCGHHEHPEARACLLSGHVVHARDEVNLLVRTFQHGDNPEHVKSIAAREAAESSCYGFTLDEWLERLHAYEGTTA